MNLNLLFGIKTINDLDQVEFTLPNIVIKQRSSQPGQADILTHI